MKVVIFDKENDALSLPYNLKDISKPVMFDLPTDPNNHKSLKFVLLHPDRYELRPVLEGVEVVFGRKLSGELGLFSEMPVLKQHSAQPIKPRGYYIELSGSLFPQIKPGQCVKAKIVLEEE